MASPEESSSKTLNERMVEYRYSNTLTDLKIKIDEREFNVHKIVLMGASSVFKAMISDRWLKKGALKLYSEYVDPEIFDDLLNFLYIDDIKLTPENVKPLAKAANFLDVSKLVSLCESFMIKQISEENSDDFYKFSKSYNFNQLKEVLIEKMILKYQNYPENMSLDFEFEDFQKILKEWKFQRTTSETKEKYYECIIAWIKHDEENRKPLLSNLLESIPFNKLSYRFLRDKVCPEAMIRESRPCCIRVLDILTRSADIKLRKREHIIQTLQKEIRKMRKISEEVEDDLGNVLEEHNDLEKINSSLEDLLTKTHEDRLDQLKEELAQDLDSLKSIISQFKLNVNN